MVRGMAAGKQVNVHRAKTELSKLLAQVERGAEIVIARGGTPIAKLVPLPKPGKRRLRVGNWKGQIWMSADFDAPLSEGELKDWGY
jgi:prevent-host-death family protein